MIWFTADWHLGHSNILKHQPERYFEDIESMNNCFIDKCNAVVKPKDTLYFLGDFCWQASEVQHFRRRINVKGFYVCRGNHDRSSLAKYVTLFDYMIFPKVRIDNEIIKLHLCHYPLRSWDSKTHGSYHLHGHSHGNLPPNERMLDVGIDNIHNLLGEWRPINLDEILKLLGTK